MTTEQKTTSIEYIETADVRKSLRETGWGNVARVTIETPGGGTVASPRISMGEFRHLLNAADEGNDGRLVVQEDRHPADNYGTEHGSRTFYVRGYQYPRSR